MANKISVILDVATDKAVSGLKGFKQAISDADGATGKMKAGAGAAFDSIKANAGLMGVAVVGAVGTMAAKSIEAASKLGESVNAVNVTFGKSAEGIKALGEEAAESVGLSNSAFNSLAVQFSSFATTIAGEKGNVVGTMDEMTTRIADFASVMNLDVPEAAAIFQSSLAGETESIRRFGIDLSAATVETFAYANGIGKVGTKLTEGEKVQARYALLMRETDKTAGDFANTSDGLANSQRILAAKMEDTAAKVGKNLAPALATVTTVLSDMIPVAGQVAVGVGTAFTKMADGAYELGKSFTEVIDLIPFLNTSEPVAESLYEQQKLARGTADLVAEYAKGRPTMEAFAAALAKDGVNTHAANLAKIEYRKQLEGVHDVAGDVIEVTEELAAVTDVYTLRTDMASFAIEAKKRSDEEAADAAQAHTEAMEDQVEALTALVGGDIAVRDAQREATAAVLELTTAMDAGELSAEELAAQTDATALELIGAATAAADYDEKLGEANGEILSAQGKQDLLRQKLEELAATLAPGSALRTQLQGYIDDLNSVPTDIRTTFTQTGATGSHQGPIRGTNAAGTSNWRGGVSLVGEQGPELVNLPAGSQVFPAGQTAQMLSNMMPAGGNSYGGATTAVFNLVVNAGMGTDGREVGDVILDTLAATVRRNGPGVLVKLTGG